MIGITIACVSSLLRSVFQAAALVMCMALCFTVNAGAADTVTLVDGTEVYPLTHLPYLEDKDGRMNLNQVMAGEGEVKFSPATKASLSEILCVRHTIPSKEIHAPHPKQVRD